MTKFTKYTLVVLCFASIILANVQAMPCNESDHGDIRLKGGESILEGRIEVCRCNEDNICDWGTVCPNDWDNNDARVVCRQLGFSAQHSSPSIFQEENSNLRNNLDAVRCNGSEDRLLNCQYNQDASDPDCTYWEDIGVVAGVHCQPPEPQNISAESFEESVSLSWRKPLFIDVETNILYFIAECFITSPLRKNYVYGAHSTISMANQIQSDYLANVSGLSSSTSYDCCVTAIYTEPQNKRLISPIKCVSTNTTGTNEFEPDAPTSDPSAVTTECCMACSESLSSNNETSFVDSETIYCANSTVVGVLGAVTTILIVVVIVMGAVLVHLLFRNCSRVKTKSNITSTTENSTLHNPTYGRVDLPSPVSEPHNEDQGQWEDTTTSQHYSSLGPTYAMVSSNQDENAYSTSPKGRSNTSHTAFPDASHNAPGVYELPVKSSAQMEEGNLPNLDGGESEYSHLKH